VRAHDIINQTFVIIHQEVFMQRLRYAFRFIEASFSKLSSNSRQLQIWLSFALGCVAIFAIALIPLGVIIRYLGLSPLGLALIGLIAAAVFLGSVLWGKVNALETSQIFYQEIQPNELVPNLALEARVRQKHWTDAALWLLAKPSLQLAYRRTQFFQGQVKNQPVWLDAYLLILPLIAVEDLSFTQAIQRSKEIHEDKLVRFRSDLVAVRMVGAVLQWFLVIGSAIIGVLVAFNIAYATTTGFRRRLLGMGVGLLIIGAATLIGIGFKNFTEACYHTALYQWVRNVASARQLGDKTLAHPPDILRQVFGKRHWIEKEN
jgi:hypothetical protein